MNVKHHERKKRKKKQLQDTLCRLLRLSLQVDRALWTKATSATPCGLNAELLNWPYEMGTKRSSQKIWSFEERETLPADTKPRTSHHRSPGGREAWKEEALDDLPWNDERAIVNQTNIATVSKATLGTLLTDGVARILWAFPSAQIYHLKLTETGTKAPFWAAFLIFPPASSALLP